MLNEKLARAARAILGLTQAEVAKSADVAVKTIADLERGTRLPLPRTLRDIQRAFEEMGVEFLFEDGRAVGLRFKKHIPDAAP